jgi:hypothetical protein
MEGAPEGFGAAESAPGGDDIERVDGRLELTTCSPGADAFDEPAGVFPTSKVNNRVK